MFEASDLGWYGGMNKTAIYLIWGKLGSSISLKDSSCNPTSTIVFNKTFFLALLTCRSKLNFQQFCNRRWIIHCCHNIVFTVTRPKEIS